MLNIYGIPNCDTVKKTRKYLELHETEYCFVNFKKNPPTKELIEKCLEFSGDYPVNKRGTTYRKFKNNYMDSDDNQKIELLILESSMIKRPIIEKDGAIISIGHDEEILTTMI